MKKLFLSIAFIFAVSSGFSQNKKTPEVASERNTTEMVKFLELDESTEKNLYKIHLEKNKQLFAIREDSSLSAEEKKLKKKATYKQAQKGFREILSSEQMKAWNQHKNPKK